MTRDMQKRAEWDKENTMMLSVRLMKSTDADIIGYIENRVEAGETRQGIIKRSLRSTMKEEGYQPEQEKGS